MSFERFALERVGTLLRLGTAMCGDSSTAEDLVQDVLVKVHRHWDHIAGLDVPEAYVRRMLVNEFLTMRRKASRQRLRSVVDLPEAEPDPATVHAERDALRREIVRLPRQQQVVLALRYYGGLTDVEIAEALDCAPGTVRGYASRALSSLRVQLSEPAEGRTT